MSGGVGCAARLEAIALPGLPIVSPGDDLGAIIQAGLRRAELSLGDGDVVVVASKLVSRTEGRFVDLDAVVASPRAHDLAAKTGHDPRHVEVILGEAVAVSRAAPGLLIVRHRLGFVVANAGVDFSNAAPPREVASRGVGPWALTLPLHPDGAAMRLKAALAPVRAIGVVISDSFGRPFRVDTVGTAIGAADMPVLSDHRGRQDLFGRPLERTVTALADQVAAVADLVAGQADEGRGVVVVRGLSFAPATGGAGGLLRPALEDVYA